MSCPSELDLFVFADGESADPAAMAAHLAGCARCRDAVARLEADRRGLALALGAPEPLPTPVRPPETAWSWLAAAAVVAAPAAGGALLEALGDLLPLATTAALAWAAAALLDVFEGGSDMLATLLPWIAALGAALVALAVLRPRPRAVAAALLPALALLGTASPAAAFEVRKGDHPSVEAGETLEQTVVLAGDSIEVAGTVDGDVVAVGKRVTISGTVKGNVLALARDVSVPGNVDGSLYCGGNACIVTGTALGSVVAAGQTAVLSRTSRAGRDALVLGESVRAEGTVGRDLQLLAGEAELAGSVGRTVDARARSLSVLAAAKIGGDLRLHAPSESAARVNASATVGGRRTFEPVHDHPAPKHDWGRAGFYVRLVLRLLAALLTALVLQWLFPRLFTDPFQSGGTVLRRMGAGFVFLVVVPFAVVVVAMTIIGLPIALAALALYLLALYVAGVVVGVGLGRRILGPAAASPRGSLLASLLGIALVVLASSLPFAGPGVRLLVALLGLGTLLARLRAAREPVVPAPPAAS